MARSPSGCSCLAPPRPPGPSAPLSQWPTSRPGKMVEKCQFPRPSERPPRLQIIQLSDISFDPNSHFFSLINLDKYGVTSINLDEAQIVGAITQARDLRHYSLFSLMSAKLTLFTLFLIFETLFIIFVKFTHYLYQLDTICLIWFKIGS